MEEEGYRIREDSSIDLSLKNLVTIIIAVGTAVYLYFGMLERLNTIETSYKLIQGDLEKNTDFRIRWPRGELGKLPDDSKQFMLIEHLTTRVIALEEQMKARNKSDVEALKDKVREYQSPKINLIPYGGAH